MDSETEFTTETDQPAQKLQAEKAPKNWALISRLLIGAIIAAIFLVFVFQNAEKTDISFLGWDTQIATSILMLLCAAVGVVTWELAGFISRRARRKD